MNEHTNTPHRMLTVLLRLLLVLGVGLEVLPLLRCGPKPSELLLSTRYYRIKACHKLNGSIIARAPLAGFKQCAAFAAEHRGLAFNFSPYRVRHGASNCEVLGCPDLDVAENSRRLLNDSRYDYYALHGNADSVSNASCVSGVGLFTVRLDAENYTRAENVCAVQGARLAHIATAERSMALAELLASALRTWTKAAYVGLQVAQPPSAGATTVTQESLDCYEYRAWAPGHPRQHNHHHCVLLDEAGLWRTVQCAQPFPFLCEILPEPPFYKHYQLYNNTSCSNIRNKTVRTTCKTIKKKYKAAILSTRKYKKRHKKSECEKLTN